MDRSPIARYPPLAAALGMIALFLAADHLRLSFFIGYICALLACGALIGWYAWARCQSTSPSNGTERGRTLDTMRVLFAFFCGVCLAATTGYQQQKQMPPIYNAEHIDHIEATLTAPSAIYADFTILSLTLRAIHSDETVSSASGALRCFYNEQIDLDAKMQIHAHVVMRAGEKPVDPPRCTIINIIHSDRVDNIGSRVASWRGKILTAMRSTLGLFPRSTVPLLHALFLGERTDLNPAIALRFRTAGLTHLLALSGMHLAIISTLSTILLRAVVGRRGAYIGTIVFVIAYVWLIGNKPSLNRAAIMLILWSLLQLHNRNTEPINILAYALIALTLHDPTIRSDLSFQLSFAALAGIIGISGSLRRALQRAFPVIVAQPLALTLAAQITTLPLLIYHFGVWYPIGIIGSLAITPLVTLFMWSAVALVPFYYIPIAILHPLIDRYLIILYAIVQRGVHIFAQFPAYQF